MVYRKTKEMLRNALEDVAEKGELTSSNLKTIKDLLCSIKYANDIANDEKSNYENNSFDSRPSRNYNYGYDYDQGESYAPRRNGRSRHSGEHEAEINEIVADMHELKNRISDPETKRKIEKLIKDIKP